MNMLPASHGMPPLKAPRAFPEDKLHVGVWRALQYVIGPEVVFWSNENRHNGLNEGRRRKSRGCIAGIPDLQVAWNGKVVFIELKTKTGALSSEQRALHARLKAAGFCIAVCRSLDDVLDFLRSVGCPMRSAS